MKFFRYNLKLIACIGLDWDNRNFFYRLYGLIIAMLVSVFIVAEFLFIFAANNSVVAVIKTLNVVAFDLTGVYQVIMWKFYAPSIKKIINALDSINSYKNRITRHVYNYNNKYVLFIVVCIVGELSLTYLRAYFYAPKHRDNDKVVGQELPYNNWFPFDYQQSTWHFNVAFVYQFLSMLLFAYVVAGPHLLFPGIMINLSGQFQEVAVKFETLRERQTCRPDESIDDELQACIVYLQQLLDISMEFRDIMAICLIGILPASFVICSSLLLIAKESLVESFSSITYAFTILVDLYFHCWFGNEVAVQSTAISRHVYALDWLQQSKQVQLNIYFTLIRLKRPIVITIGKIMPLTLQTFINILRTSYSFYTLLVRMAE